jgi:hypothetical protein
VWPDWKKIRHLANFTHLPKAIERKSCMWFLLVNFEMFFMPLQIRQLFLKFVTKLCQKPSGHAEPGHLLSPIHHHEDYVTSWHRSKQNPFVYILNIWVQKLGV